MPQKVLVTAGANGIGLAIARRFAAGGAKVHIADMDEKAVAGVLASGLDVTATIADISVAADVARVFADMGRMLGGLDVLVNNAGIAGPTAPVEAFDFAAWQAVMNVNLSGTFLVTQQAIPLLKQSAQASVVVMSSVAGRYGYANRSAYSTSKWGLVGFAKSLALELGSFGITCNTIHPGAVEGDRVRRVFEGRAELSGRTVEEERAFGMQNQSIKRFTDPADVAELVHFLAGPHARTISGQMFPIDGDSKAAQ